MGSRRAEDLWAAFDFPRHPLAREDGERVCGAFYAPPAQHLRAFDLAEVPALIGQAQQAAQEGAWVLGGLRYEAAQAFDAAMPAPQGTGAALAEFAVFSQAPEPWPEAVPAGTGFLHWRDIQAEPDERAQMARIRRWIQDGDCYQVNLCTRMAADVLPTELPDLAQIFLALHASQPGGFSLFLREAGVASVSPELFFDWRLVPGAEQSWLLAAQPMKGTAPRGFDLASDDDAQAYLRTSEKERAENLMIVDLLRNDLSRVARLGSVRVPRLFELLALPTVWQMTSTVTALSRPNLRLSEVFAALFPCGSVTGAPKLRAMQIIRELEPGPRGWYCGALGLLQPGGAATFNVPIRTVERDPSGGLRCGIGSAITLDSEPQAEVAEWRAKTRFLRRAEAPVAALETLRLEQGAYARLDLHLARLQRCARHFGLKFSAAKVRAVLDDLAGQHADGIWRVRLTLDAQGGLATQVLPLPATPAVVQLALAKTPMDSHGAGAEFVQHKTTRRELYEAFAQGKPPQAFDVLLWNAGGELTECSFGNIALQIDGKWLTPDLRAGLLSGVMRQALLGSGQLHEARLLKTDLARAQALAFFNSLRGWCPAELLPDTDTAPSPAGRA
ncbi:MAG: chorismate-binding protein [Burkholderiaceae bacterium]|nr:chorismate-binding protein [Roseateles sp.]MBV8470380.1 chorismate-binding protein [Burkholderiaceae bacterium]